MRLAIISDTHMPRGARAIPAACLEQCAAADAILHAGDLSDVSVLDLLRGLGPPVHAIHGNVDSAGVRHLLPARLQRTFGGVRIGMTHIPGPAAGRLATAADAVSALRRGRLRPHPHARARGRRRLSDLQPRLADRAPPGARAHDGDRDDRRRRITFELLAGRLRHRCSAACAVPASATPQLCSVAPVATVAQTPIAMHVITAVHAGRQRTGRGYRAVFVARAIIWYDASWRRVGAPPTRSTASSPDFPRAAPGR